MSEKNEILNMLYDRFAWRWIIKMSVICQDLYGVVVKYLDKRERVLLSMCSGQMRRYHVKIVQSLYCMDNLLDWLK